MGLPQIIIRFKTAGGTAIRRSARGQAVLLLAGETAGSQSFSRLDQIDRTVVGERAWTLLRLCFLGNPAKVWLVTYPQDGEQEALEGVSALAEGGWMCAPDMDSLQLVEFVQAKRAKGRPIRAVVSTSGSPDNAGVVNFTAEGMVVRLNEERFSLIQHTENTLCAGKRGKNRAKELCHLCNRSGKGTAIFQKGNQCAKRNHTVNAHNTAADRSDCIADMRQITHDRHQHIGKGIGFGRSVTKCFIALCESFLGRLLMAKHLDNLLTFDHFFNITIHSTDCLLLLLEEFS